MKKKILDNLNVKSKCAESGTGLWQCPQFLFLIMGLIISTTLIISYLVGTQFVQEPVFVALIDIALALVLFVIAYIITKSFERLANASRMKSEFMGIVIHQLRSPITNIKWIAEFLTSKDITMPEQKKEEYFQNLDENIARMVELVDDLLIVSRIEEQSIPFNKKEASLEDIILELIERSKAFAESSGIKLKFSCSEKGKKAFFDSNMVKLVIENLMDNAIRYTKKGGKISISLDYEKNKMKFKISDEGVGIPIEDQKLIFQKFFRSGNAMKEKTKGSGLGLYIAKAIIEKSGGKIWFESSEGKGTTFYFILPVK